MKMRQLQGKKQSQQSQQFNAKYDFYEAYDQAMFSDPSARLSPDGPLSSIISNNNINHETTTDVTLANYRQGKFIERFDSLDFDEDLMEYYDDDPDSDYYRDTVWSTVLTIDEITHSFYISQAEVLSGIVLTPASEMEKQERAGEYEIDAGDTVIEIDGTEYFVDLHIPLNFGALEDNTMLLKTGLFVIGNTALAAGIAGVVAKFGIDGFKDALTHIESGPFTTLWNGLYSVMKTGYKFASKFIGQIAKGATVDAAVLAAKAAAGESWENSTKKLTPKKLKYSVVGAVVIAAISLLLNFLVYPMFQTINIYNLTEYDIDFDLPYTNRGTAEDITSSHIGKPETEYVGSRPIGEYYNGLAFQFSSDSGLSGIGYTLRFRLKNSDGDVVKTFSALFEIPHIGDNSLYALTDEPASYEDYYSQHKDEQKVTQYIDSDGQHEIIVTYDYLSGEHENPVTNQDEYLYNSLVVIRSIT